MKLYFSPNACSLAPHIILRELAIPFELVRVDHKTKRTSDGRDFLDVNPKGYVAALVLDNGQVLTEGPAIVQYLADLNPDAALAPRNGTWERVRVQEWLNFITTEMHGNCGPLFNDAIPPTVKQIFKDKLVKRLAYLDGVLAKQDYLTGEFGIADAYLYTVLSWLPRFDIDLGEWPSLARFTSSVGARESVMAALAAEAASPAVECIA